MLRRHDVGGLCPAHRTPAGGGGEARGDLGASLQLPAIANEEVGGGFFLAKLFLFGKGGL